MSESTNITGIEQGDSTDTNLAITYTQIASCIVGKKHDDHRRQSLRARLERESRERKQRIQKSFITTLRNLFLPT
jgi:hypothetical protein